LYPEHGQSDFIQDFDEKLTFDEQLVEMFPSVHNPDAIPPGSLFFSHPSLWHCLYLTLIWTMYVGWDDERKYTFDNLEVYFQAHSVPPLPGFEVKKGLILISFSTLV